jgi:thymidylate synthase
LNSRRKIESSLIEQTNCLERKMLNFRKIEQLIAENKKELGTWYDHLVYSCFENDENPLNVYAIENKTFIESVNTKTTFPINALIGFENKHIVEAVHTLTGGNTSRYPEYGDCWLNQISNVIVKLHQQHNSRQAIIQFVGGKNPSCLQTVQFLIRNNKLNIIANFRSQEIIEFAVYDICLLKYMGETVLGMLKHLYESQFEKLIIGDLTINCASSHIIIG